MFKWVQTWSVCRLHFDWNKLQSVIVLTFANQYMRMFGNLCIMELCEIHKLLRTDILDTIEYLSMIYYLFYEDK